MKVLFLTHRLPYAPNRGDRIRAFHMLAALEQQFDVTLASLVHDADEASRAELLRRRPMEVLVARVPRVTNYARAALRLPSARPLTLELLHSPALPALLRQTVDKNPPDVVLAYCSSMARYAVESPLNRYPFVLDMVDVDSEKWSALASNRHGLMRYVYARESRCLARFERRAIREATATLVVNEREEESVRRLVPDALVRVVPNGIDLTGFRSPHAPASEPVVVFCGVMNYGPNIEAAVRVARSVWPRVIERRPDAKLLLVGAHPTTEVRRLASAPGIEVTGSVPDVRPYLWRSAVAVAPLVTARGIQNKVLEALAAGLPVVISPAVADGLPAEALNGCRTASTDEEFATSILALLAETPEQRRETAVRADMSRLTWERQLRSLGDLIRTAAAQGRAT